MHEDPEVENKKLNTNTIAQSKADVVKVGITTKPKTNDTVKYPVDELIENSKALTHFGKEVAVGALFGCEEKELTKDEFTKKIKEFLRKAVK